MKPYIQNPPMVAFFEKMKISRLLLIGILISIIAGCKSPSEDIFGLNGFECKLWWIYDEGISNGSTPLFLCVNEKKYGTYSITRFGSLKKPMIGDVVYPLTEHGTWEIKKDSLFLQGKGFSTIKRISDTVFLRPGAFFLDQTAKFHIINCDCDSLVAQFKGGTIDSMKTLLTYKDSTWLPTAR